MRSERRDLEIEGEHVAAVIEQPDDGFEHTVVFAHGFGSDKEGSYRHRAERAVDAGFRSVRFDFRGNNESSRGFDEATLTTRIEDLTRVLDEFESPVGVYGSSFGGLVAIHTAVDDERIGALALRAPVTFLATLEEIRSTIREEGEYEQLPGKTVDERFLDDLDGYSTADRIDDLRVPTLIMHGVEDDQVAIESSRRFFDRLSCRRRFVRFEEEGHRFSDPADDEAVATALEWFGRYL